MTLSARDRLGRYEIVGPLGAGGMGEVYRARDTELERDVAVKVLPEAVAQNPDRLERFRREAKAVAKLAHPNILEIWDYGTEGDTTYSVTELLEGETLRERLEGGTLGWRKATEIGAAIADGLAAAHEAGIVHRDLKPSNVFVTNDGRVKVLDFGLARHDSLESEESGTQAPTLTRHTDPGTVLGTVGYMSPEQVSGRAVDHRSDIFSLGCVLYEIVSGQRAFVRDTAVETMNAILKEEPPDISTSGEALPPELAGTVRRCLEKKPQSRFQSASDLAFDLRSIATRTDVGSTRRAMDGARKWQWVGLSGIAIFIAAVAIWRFAPHEEAPAHAEEIPRIVVLPFENLGSPDDEYFADGVSEEITSRLAAVTGVQVISRSSAMYYKDRHVPVRQIGEELDVGYVLEGTIRWDRGETGHGRVRITPQLIRVADDSHLWSERYDRVLEDIFTVQSDIAEEVIARLETTLLEPERQAVEARPTDNMEAYQAYLLGVQYGWSSQEERSTQLMVEMLERAVRLDPEFAVAHAVLSEAHSRLYHFRFDFTPERLEMARASAKRAMDLKPGLPEGHRALGYYYYWGLRDYDLALAEFTKAARALPNDADVLRGVVAVQRRQGRWDDALAALGRWQRIDPQRYLAAVDAEQTYVFLREYEKAEQELRRAIAIAPDLPDAYSDGTQMYVLWDGSTQRARRIVESAPSLYSPRFNYYSLLLDVFDRKPEKVTARLEGRSIEAFDLQECYVPRDLLECRCLFDLGEVERGKAACASAVAVIQGELRARPGDFRLFIALGHAFSLVGRKEEAVLAGERAIELVPISKDALEWSDQAIELAQIYSRVGEADEALDLIEELLSIPCYLSVGLLRLDPAWDPLRDDPRFQALLEEYATN